PPQPSDVAPPSDPPVPDVPVAGGALPGLGPAPSAGARPAQGDVVPLYRLETATYAVVPPLLREASLASLGTFHERQGEQRLLYNNGALRTAWGRLVGQSSEIQWKGDAQPGFDGDLMGVQAGLDVWAAAADAHRNQIGVFVGRTRADGRVTGLALGWENVQVGQSRLDDKHVGLYWTLTGRDGGYLDAVAMQSRYDGRMRSSRGLGIDVRGDGTTLSLEAGKPLLQFGQSAWWLEPQIQVIWQRSSLDDQRDAVSAVSFDSDNAWTGRVGLRLAADYQLADNGWQPYFKLNYWHGRSGEDRVQFDTDVITSAQRSRALEAGIGVVGRFNRTISAYAVADYTREVGGSRNEERRVIEGNIGLRADW
ncbi:autotransporter outer membrane beta-barrel domain-containing protein, partial [Stenotrophomonas sp.]|uniref:autotransporter family protein n=1 Tax=Stenotrophomonas sp. TaxID=69392 RepID=UPI0028B081A6